MCGAEDEVGVAVLEHVLAVVTIDPLDRRVDVVLPGLDRPLAPIGRRARGPVELVGKDVRPATPGRRRRLRRCRARRGFREGIAAAQHAEPRRQQHAATIHIPVPPIVRTPGTPDLA